LTRTVRSARVYVLRCGGPDHGGRERNPPRIPACGSPLVTPWGTFTRELVRLALEHSGRTSARAGNRVAGGGSAVTLQRDAAEVHACRRAARAHRREPGHGRARQPAEHRSTQCEAPLTAPAVAGASPCDGGGSPSPPTRAAQRAPCTGTRPTAVSRGGLAAGGNRSRDVSAQVRLNSTPSVPSVGRGRRSLPG
jgi:hypothetical protein